MANISHLKSAPIETLVGEQIRRRRIELGMRQDQLALALGVTFQQIHKYERGINRVSAGNLWLMAEVLEVPITYFFEGVSSKGRQPPMPKRYEAKLLGGVARMPEEARVALVALAALWADDQEEGGP